jgi:hypothetical protein
MRGEASRKCCIYGPKPVSIGPEGGQIFENTGPRCRAKRVGMLDATLPPPGIPPHAKNSVPLVWSFKAGSRRASQIAVRAKREGPDHP